MGYEHGSLVRAGASAKPQLFTYDLIAFTAATDHSVGYYIGGTRRRHRRGSFTFLERPALSFHFSKRVPGLLSFRGWDTAGLPELAVNSATDHPGLGTCIILKSRQPEELAQ